MNKDALTAKPVSYTHLDRRFLMKRVGEVWMIDAVQERLNGWQRTGLDVYKRQEVKV